MVLRSVRAWQIKWITCEMGYEFVLGCRNVCCSGMFVVSFTTVRVLYLSATIPERHLRFRPATLSAFHSRCWYLFNHISITVLRLALHCARGAVSVRSLYIYIWYTYSFFAFICHREFTLRTRTRVPCNANYALNMKEGLLSRELSARRMRRSTHCTIPYHVCTNTIVCGSLVCV